MKILVGYATGYGSTKSYAEVIAEELRASGNDADVLPAKEVKELAPYDFVVVGGSLRAGSWLGQARTLAKKVLNAEKPHSVFICCLSVTTEEGRRQLDDVVLPKLKQKLPGLNLETPGLFPGMRNMDRYRFPIRGIMRSIAEKEGISNLDEPLDYRDFELARVWARGLAGKLTRSEP
jgi:menaquinone-dependent protoporphyrinogen oxidase